MCALDRTLLLEADYRLTRDNTRELTQTQSLTPEKNINTDVITQEMVTLMNRLLGVTEKLPDLASHRLPPPAK